LPLPIDEHSALRDDIGEQRRLALRILEPDDINSAANARAELGTEVDEPL
jgi:hypothetical protein